SECAIVGSCGPWQLTADDTSTWVEMMTRKTHAWLVLGATLALTYACGDAADEFTYMDDDIPSGRCDTDGEPDGCADTGGSSSVTGEPDGGLGSPCGRSGECDGGLVCSA